MSFYSGDMVWAQSSQSQEEDQRTNADPNTIRSTPPVRERITNAPYSRDIPRNDQPLTDRDLRLEPREGIRNEELEAVQPPSEFQEFILSSTGKKLPIFGSELFRRVPTTFAPVDRIPVTGEYMIGPGDEILLRGWGQIDVDYHATVDRLGNIFVPRVGNISVAGIKYGQLQQYLKSQFERVFRNFDLNVTLGQLRSIQIFIVGQARRPGSYTVSSLSTLVNAVFATGGPSNKGSMRHIQLKRNSQAVAEFDLYDLLSSGDKSKDMPLLPGDVIYFPAVGPQVAIIGSVNLPAVYEIKPEASLGDLLKYAGGLTPVASGSKATVERITDRTVRRVEEFELNASGLARPLQDGDLVTVRPLSARFDNAVTLRGNVAVPARYPWKEGIKVRDLIPDREALVTRRFWMKQSDLAKAEPEERFYKDRYGRDVPLDEQETSVKDRESQTPAEEDDEFCQQVQKENPRDSDISQDRKLEREKLIRDICRDRKQNPSSGNKERSKGVTKLRNQIQRNAPEINWDYAVVQRFNRKDLTTDLYPFNLGRAIADASSGDNLALEPGDVITIFSQADIKVPESKRSKFIRLEGEFKVAGVYEVGSGETLRHLAERVGGLTPNSYLFGAEFIRESTREAQQLRLDEFVRQLELDVERASSVRAQNVASAEEAAGLSNKIESQRKLVDKIRQLKATGRVVLGMRPNDQEISALPDFVLEDGDQLFVPYKPATVNVVGAVFSDNSFLYQGGKSPDYYVHKAGGGTKNADRGHIFVVRADGSIVSKHQHSGWFGNSFSDLQMMPGDTIVVPEQLDKTSLLKGLKDWSQVLAQFALGAAALKTLSP